MIEASANNKIIQDVALEDIDMSILSYLKSVLKDFLESSFPVLAE